MPIRGSPDGAHHPRPQAGRDRPEWVVAISGNAWSQSIGMSGRDQSESLVAIIRCAHLFPIFQGWERNPVGCREAMLRHPQAAAKGLHVRHFDLGEPHAAHLAARGMRGRLLQAGDQLLSEFAHE